MKFWSPFSLHDKNIYNVIYAMRGRKLILQILHLLSTGVLNMKESKSCYLGNGYPFPKRQNIRRFQTKSLQLRLQLQI